MFWRKDEAAQPAYEGFLYRNAIALLALAILYGVESFRFFLGLELHDYYYVGRKIFGLAIVVLLLPSVLRVVSRRWQNRGQCSYEDDFIINTYKNACVHGFTFIVVALIGVQAVAKTYLGDVPLDILAKSILSLTFIVLSFSFFYQLRDTDGEGDEYDDEDAA